jgi:hypothetical protein
MKTYLIAAALVVGPFYIVHDNSMNGCSIMTTRPSGAQYKIIGEYKSKAEAEAAVKTVKGC